jgi:hypothetical protein
MEAAVREIEEPSAAFEAILNARKRLEKQSGAAAES